MFLEKAAAISQILHTEKTKQKMPKRNSTEECELTALDSLTAKVLVYCWLVAAHK